jgi:hypothetical protein
LTLKRKTKLHRDTLRRLTSDELRISAGDEAISKGCPLKSGKLTCGGETVDTCENVTSTCAPVSRACLGTGRTCKYSSPPVC